MMKGASRVIMGLTLVMVISLALVLALVLVLLAELYCTLILRRRQLRITTATTTAATAAPSHQPPQPQTLSGFYAHGVLTAPRSFLFPAVSGSGGGRTDIENPHSQLPEIHQPENPKPVSVADQQPVQTVYLEKGRTSGCCDEFREELVYISNPIYDNEASRVSRVDTPFETPDTSPSRLETEDSDGDEVEIEKPMVVTPPLTPMKELPAEACSVAMKDARSLGTSGSDSNNGVSSSSSGTPCTSPSW